MWSIYIYIYNIVCVLENEKNTQFELLKKIFFFFFQFLLK
jgi:hypothetical protein